MQNAVGPRPAELEDWLRRMNWAGDGERNLFLLASVCCILLPPLGIASLGLIFSLLLLVSHTVLLMYCATMVQRRFSIASCLIIIISLANLLLANYSGLKHAGLLIWFFCGLALISLPFGISGWRRAEARARAALEFRSRDDYRWLLTQAPLLYRWRFQELLAATTPPGK